jgi:hypothetical protein
MAIEAVSAVIRPAHQYSSLSALLARLEAGGIALRFSIGIGKISCRDNMHPMNARIRSATHHTLIKGLSTGVPLEVPDVFRKTRR